MTDRHHSSQARSRAEGGDARARLLELMLAKERERADPPQARSERLQWSGPIPLSYEQERLWFVERMGLVGTAYNLSLGLRLRGKLSESALEQALKSLVSRHEVLRTHFDVAAERPSQAIEELREVRLHGEDLRDLSDPALRARHLQQVIHREQEHRFTLSEGPMLRALLVRLQADEHVLLLTVHHIVSDGWSLELMLSELATLYTSNVQSMPSGLPALPMQYADYAIWQRRRSEQSALKRHLQYWREQLTGAPPLLEIATDRPRPAVESFKGAQCAVQLSSDLVGRLKALARDQGATLFMVALAAYQILLSRWSRQRDIVVGTPVAIRPREDLEHLIGNFVNMLALRTDVDAELTFRQLLERVKDVALGAYAHQEMQFDALVTELRPDRSLTAHPIFQVTIVMQNYPQRRLDLGDLTWESLELESTTTHFDLTLGMTEGENGTSALLIYAVDLFDSETIERMSRQFAKLLESIVENPHAPVHRLEMLPSDESSLLLKVWNDTAVDRVRQQPVHKMFAGQAAACPDAVALRQGEREVTYRELEQRSNQLAHHLRDLGVGPDRIVALCMERSVDLVVGLLGVLKAGGAYLPLDPKQPDERSRFIMSDAGVSVLLSNAEIANRLRGGAPRAVCVDQDAEHIAVRSNQAVDVETLWWNLAYVIYTSGSTGVPKGVMVEHGALLNYVQWALRVYQPESGEAIPISSPMSFDATATGLYCALLSGRSAILLQDGQELQELEHLLKRSERQLSLIKVSPAHMQALGPALQSAKPPRGLNTVVVGGEALPAQTVLLWRSFWPELRIFNQYGPTETVIACCAYEVPQQLPSGGTVPIGRPADNVEAYVLDTNLMPVPVGVSGELFIAGTQLGRGYACRPGMTAERFVANSFGPPGTRMYRTGDLVRYRVDGTLEFLGRIDRQVKVRGYRIELNEIEASLLKYARITHAAVVAKELSVGDVRLVAYVACENSYATAPELREYLQSQLPNYMVPNAIVILERLPLTANGKVDLRALPAAEASAFAGHDYEPAEGETEQALEEIWRECLCIDRVGRHDNFFELGGHSLLGLKLASQIFHRLSVQLSAVAVFRYPTIREMAQAVAAAQRAEQEPSSEEELEDGII